MNSKILLRLARQLAALLPALVFTIAARGAVSPPEGFTSLFNGTDLSGWHGFIADPMELGEMSIEDFATQTEAANRRMKEHWSVEGGTVFFDGGGASLISDKTYGDFELLLDWRIQEGGDSGVYLRGMPQVQIWDNPVGSGGLYNNRQGESGPMVHADRAVGEWNTFRIVMIGQRVSVWLNGIQVVRAVTMENFWSPGEPLPSSGHLALQAHGTPLAFRNAFIREIVPSAEAETLLIEPDPSWWAGARVGLSVNSDHDTLDADSIAELVDRSRFEFVMANADSPIASDLAVLCRTSDLPLVWTNDSIDLSIGDADATPGADLIRRLVQASTRSKAFAIEVSLDGTGQVSDLAADRIAMVTDWLALNGEAIFGTVMGPLRRLPWGRTTMKTLPNGDLMVYFIVLEWPDNARLKVEGLLNSLAYASMITREGRRPLLHRRSGGTLWLPVSLEPPHTTASVIAAALTETPVVKPRVLEEDAQGVISLPAIDAHIKGEAVHYDEDPEHAYIGDWNRVGDQLLWVFRIDRPGTFGIFIDYACGPDGGGSFRVDVNGQGINTVTGPTGSWDQYTTRDFGNLFIRKSGQVTFTMSALSLDGDGAGIMNIKRVRLRREGQTTR